MQPDREIGESTTSGAPESTANGSITDLPAVSLQEDMADIKFFPNFACYVLPGSRHQVATTCTFCTSRTQSIEPPYLEVGQNKAETTGILQKEGERAESLEAGPQGDDREGQSRPYRLVVSNQQGKASSSQLNHEDHQWFLAIEWGAEAAGQYDPGCIDEPVLHDSVRQAKARLAAGPKPFDLDECIEVSWATAALIWLALHGDE